MTVYHIEELFQEAEKLKVTVMTLEEKIKSILGEKDDEITLEYGDTYWVIRSDGEIRDEMWTDHPCDDSALKNNAIFKTQEEAEFEAGRLKVLRKLEKLGRAFEKDNLNFAIYINGRNDITIDQFTFNGFYGDYYFDTEEEAKRAIEKIGEDVIKKYLFGIED